VPAWLTLEVGIGLLVLAVASATLYVAWDHGRSKLKPEIDTHGRTDYLYLYCVNSGLQTIHVRYFEWFLDGKELPTPPPHGGMLRSLQIPGRRRAQVATYSVAHLVSHAMKHGGEPGSSLIEVVAVDDMGRRYRGETFTLPAIAGGG
jgi:hypothetical protein